MKNLHRVMHEMFGEGFTLPTQGRDPELLHAVQLEYIAGYLDCQAQESRQALAYTPPEGTAFTTASVPAETVIKEAVKQPVRKSTRQGKK